KLATKIKPDLIMLDINLPGMSGYEVLEQLKKHNETNNIPVIAISANAMPQDISKGKEAGFDDYITKPVDTNILLKTIDSYLTNEITHDLLNQTS
ncbi:MAG: response regulator, partial [Gammaproteobacteria bacterium]|nr:response regulator [Gammaproteobacteria bacterium]